ncbi:hypothetical protein CALCODRAFT_507164 [Calocera cornea HHB12733]|uniref:Uncharacterized protein n=1 Tax=Calocera cornea HHB12733 TaxID=1353952 RepID=A0A165I150_9BASI|nr:hypothetical protein CALCODRAFT_507164 [Calocera cornea HHB12733]
MDDSDTYSVVWKNISTSPFKLFLADISPPHAEKLPPPDFELLPDEEYTLKWHSPGTDRGFTGTGTTSGFLRFWSIPATEMPGSGLTFGVKLERDYVGGSPHPYKVLTYVGSPTGNPDSWTDVTTELNPDYTFFVDGQGSLETYGISVKRLLGPYASLEVTIDGVYQQAAAGLVKRPRPNYYEEWVNRTTSTFELLDYAIEVPSQDISTTDIKPKVGSYLRPGCTSVLAWSCSTTEGSGYTFGFMRYWMNKGGPQDSTVLGVRIDDRWEAVEVDAKTSDPEPLRQVSTFTGPPEACFWVHIDKELRNLGLFHIFVDHKPHKFIVTITREQFTLPEDQIRCHLRITIDDDAEINVPPSK